VRAARAELKPTEIRLVASRLSCEAFRMLVDEQLGAEQVATLRRMTPEQRWRTARALYWTARRHKAAFLRSLHPDWSDETIAEEVKRIFLNART